MTIERTKYEASKQDMKKIASKMETLFKVPMQGSKL
jgi:hypothetical protein